MADGAGLVVIANAINVRIQEALAATHVGELLVNALLGCIAFPLIYWICAAFASCTVDGVHGKGKGRSDG